MRGKLLLIVLLLPTLGVASELPNYVLRVPETVKTILVAETETATLHHYTVNQAAAVAVNSHRMSIGQNGAGKQRTGDRRTPLGVYFVVENLDTRSLHEKYGPVAFPLDYPNAWDVVNARSGYGIWIHGVTPGGGQRPERDTDGCIALANDDLLALEPQLAPLRTPVIVTRRIADMEAAESAATSNELMAALRSWQQSYYEGDWSSYLSYYAEEFVHRGMNKAEWSSFRLQTQANRVLDDFDIDEIYLFRDPEEEGLYLSRFEQRIVEQGSTVAMTKRLYWRRDASGAFRIVAEDNG